MMAQTRSLEQIREQYLVEKELARRLKEASREERRTLYTALYDELFRRVRHHPQLTCKVSPEESKALTDWQLLMLAPFTGEETVFLEVGPGDCSLSKAMARRVARVYAVDVSYELTSMPDRPPNLELAISDGSSIPVPAGCVNLAYSNQLMEHLHPDDALHQLREIFAALAPGARYVCLTPNRISGPHDISKYFDRDASGFHLHEYTARELARLMRDAGFRRVRFYFLSRTARFLMPAFVVTTLEALLGALPYRLRHAIACTGPVRKLLGVNVVASK